MKNIISSLIFLLLAFPHSTFASSAISIVDVCNNNDLGSKPVQSRGRVKPIYVHAREMITYLGKKKDINPYSFTQAYCLLSFAGMGIPTPIKLTLHVEHVKTKEFLDGKSSLPYSEALSLYDEIRVEYMKQEENNSYKKSLNRILNKLKTYQTITNGQDWTFPEVADQKDAWPPLVSFITEEKFLEAKEKSNTPFTYLINKAASNYEAQISKKHLFEYKYAKANLPTIALFLTLIALAFLTLFKKFNIALFFTSLTALTLIVLMAARIYISGRAPITNMYETVMFSGFGALILAMVIGHLKKEKVFIFIGLCYTLCTLFMMRFATGMLSESISPLVPVLRDNFWLSTHVSTIIFSYGALALSWILANMVLIKRRFIGLSSKDERYYSDLIYSCLKYGTVTLAAGIILGGVWADYSWGRFWGWDPKETWSLIVLCLYMAILHGKNTSWISPSRFATLTAAAFMSVMMAWFGVNYILATGLHSYGFSEGGAVFLGSFFFIQSIIILLTLKNRHKKTVE